MRIRGWLVLLVVALALVAAVLRFASGPSRESRQGAQARPEEVPGASGGGTAPRGEVQGGAVGPEEGRVVGEAIRGDEGHQSSEAPGAFARPPARLWIDEFEPLANDLIAGVMTHQEVAELLTELACAMEGLEPELQEDESRTFEIEQEGYGQVVVTLPPHGPGVNVAITSLQPTAGWDHDDSPGCSIELQFDVHSSGAVRYEASAQTFFKHAATARYQGGEARPAGAVLNVRAGETTWKPILVTMVEHQGRPAQKMSMGEAVTASYDPRGEGMLSIGDQLARIRGER